MPPRYLRDTETNAVYPWSESWSKMPNMEPYNGVQSMGMAVAPVTVVVDEPVETPVETPVEPVETPVEPKRRGRRKKG